MGAELPFCKMSLGGVRFERRKQEKAMEFWGPQAGRIGGDGNLVKWNLPRQGAMDGSMTWSELRRVTKAVGATRVFDHARDKADTTAAKRRWGAAKALVGATRTMKHQASITSGTSRPAGAFCGRAPSSASMHYMHQTHWPYEFSEEEKRQFAIGGERR